MLHFVSTSPFQHTALQECRKVAQDGDALVLLADGVYAVLKGEELFSGLQVFTLKDHITTRGITAPSWITCIDYDELVALSCQHQPAQTWC